MFAAINGHTDTAGMLIIKHSDVETLTFWTNCFNTFFYPRTYRYCLIMLISLGADLTYINSSRLYLSNINAQKQIRLMYDYADKKLDYAKTLNKPYSKNFIDKISLIKTQIDRTFKSTDIAEDEKRKELGEINKQLLKLQFLEIGSEKLQTESILDATKALYPNSEFNRYYN